MTKRSNGIFLLAFAAVMVLPLVVVQWRAKHRIAGSGMIARSAVTSE